MKKYLLIALLVVLSFGIAGCSKKNQVVCTQTETQNGITIKGEVIVDFDKDDKLTDATAVYDVSDKTTAEQYCSFMKLMEDAAKGVKVDCSGTKITINGFAQVDSEEDEEKIVGMSKTDFIEKMKAEDMTCK